MNFDQAFTLLLSNEGGYVDHPEDPGGATRWGITARVAMKNGYTGDMREFPVDLAKRIAKASYWDAVRSDELPDVVRFDVFDAAYNHGPKQSILFLQRAIGVTADGVIGPQTINAARAQKGQKIVMRFNAERLDFYTSLNTWPTFGRGWARRVRDNLRHAADVRDE